MRKSGYVGTYAFFIFERKVNYVETGNQFLGTERIGKLMRQYAIPCIISTIIVKTYRELNIGTERMGIDKCVDIIAELY